MILVLWLAHLLWFVARVTKNGGDALYSVWFTRDLQRMKRDADAKVREAHRRDATAIDDLIAETRPVKRVGSPINRDR